MAFGSLGILDNALSQFDGVIASAYPTLATDAKLVWLALVGIEVGIIFWQAGQRADMEGLCWSLISGLVGAGVSLAILEHSLEWATALIHTGEEIAVAAGGVPSTAVTPSAIIDQGFAIANTLWNAIGLGAWLVHTSDTLALWIAGFITAVAFFGAGLVYFFTALFTTFSAAWGCFVLQWTALEWTWPIVFRWIDEVLVLTIKLAVILLIVGAGMGMINRFQAELNAGLSSGRGVVWNYWGLMIGLVSVLWFVIIKELPKFLSNIVAVTWLNPGNSWVSSGTGLAAGAAMAVATAGVSEVATSAVEIASKVRGSLTT